jgi:hypothetical protein
MDLDKRIEILRITAAILASSDSSIGFGEGFPFMSGQFVDSASALLQAAEKKAHQLDRTEQPKS